MQMQTQQQYVKTSKTRSKQEARRRRDRRSVRESASSSPASNTYDAMHPPSHPRPSQTKHLHASLKRTSGREQIMPTLPRESPFVTSSEAVQREFPWPPHAATAGAANLVPFEASRAVLPPAARKYRIPLELLNRSYKTRPRRCMPAWNARGPAVWLQRNVATITKSHCPHG